MKSLSIYILVFFIGVTSLQAQVTFKSTVSKKELGLNERLRIEFSMNKQGGDDFTPPDFSNFKVLAGPSQSTSFSSINGKTSFKQTYTYIIQPLRKGNFTIPSASITYKGQIIKTNTVRIAVSDAVAIPKDENDPRYVASQNVHIVAEVSNTTPYVGESISVIYKLYVNTGKVRVQNTRENSSPSFNGFWNQNIKVENWVARKGTYKGEEHNYVVVKKAVLIPHKSGKLSLDPLEMEITAGVPMGRTDFFGNMMFNDVTFTETSGNRIINVKELPLENKPLNFNGAVGDFKFDISTSKETLKANESANIKVVVKGKGNLKLIELPKFIAPSGLEVYEPEHNENIRTNLAGLQGTIQDQYAIVPQFKGKFKIPEISFSYFNPLKEKYMTITSDPIFINVPQGNAPIANTNNNDGSVVTKQTIVSNENDIRFIKTKASLKPAEVEDEFYGSTLFYLLLLGPLLSIPLGIFIGNKKQARDKDIVGNKKRRANRLARKYLSAAKKQLGHKEAFYEALERALHNYLKAKLQIETSEMSMDRIADLLSSKNVDSDSIKEFKEVIDDCNYARYTPSSSSMMKEEFDKAKMVISKLDRFL